MKESYKYNNGEVEILDYNSEGIKTIINREYQDNIEEIIDLENELEGLSNRKNDLNNQIIDKKDVFSKIKDKLKHYTLLGVLLGLICLDDSFSTFREVLFALVPVVGIADLVVIIPELSLLKNREKINRKIRLRIDNINKISENKKNDLEILNKNESRINEDAIKGIDKYISINYRDRISELDNNLKKFDDVINNDKGLLKLYEEGTLEENLSDVCNEEQIEIIKKHYKSRVKKR